VNFEKCISDFEGEEKVWGRAGYDIDAGRNSGFEIAIQYRAHSYQY
jgi:hypothetical protein